MKNIFLTLAVATLAMITMGCKNTSPTLENLSDDIKSLRAENSNIGRQLGEITTGNLALTNAVSSLQRENLALKGQVEELRVAGLELTNAIGELQAGNASLQANNAALAQQVSELSKLTNLTVTTSVTMTPTGITSAATAPASMPAITTPTATNAPAVPTPAPAIDTNGAPGKLQMFDLSPAGGVTTVSFATNGTGMVGGVPCLFNNRSSKTVQLTIQQDGGEYNANLSLPPGIRKFNLLPGAYVCSYRAENGPKQGPRKLTVSQRAVSYVDEIGLAVHGGGDFTE